MFARIAERYGLAIVIGLATTTAWAGQLHEVVRDGNILTAERLIAAGADVEAHDEAALTPLVTAALAGHQDAVVLLIEHGADPRGRDGNGFTALHAAAHSGHRDLVTLLLDHGLDVNDQQNSAEITPLHAAAERGFVDIAETLLRNGADVHLKSLTGHTPVAMAVLKTNPAVVGLLRAHGADCSAIRFDRHRDYCLNAGD
jgi:ankyrin repeat protein